MAFTTFDQVIQYMERFTNLERKTDKYSVRTYRLDRMQALMEKLGNPQDSYQIIHVAGSKGKGSTASYIASGLEAAGFVTGLYMSPHVTDYRERFTRCGRFIADEILVSTGNLLARELVDFRFCDELGENEPTTFELYTAYAFLLFKEIGCQWAVIETGLGGRLDATNIVHPKASVLTLIELEHTDILGDTIEKIAGEKAKIIKQDTPSFVALQNYPEALEVFRSEAAEKDSTLHYLGDYVSDVSDGHVCFTDGFSMDLKLAMPGLVQAQNCALALLVLRTLGLYREGLTEKALSANALPGRMESVEWTRKLYLDGAHTVLSVRNTIETFRKMFPSEGICIFGSVAGKNHEEMAKLVLESFDTVVICKPGTFKKSDPQALYELFMSLKKEHQSVVLIEDASEALSYCQNHTEKDEAVLACGSFYLAGVIKEALAACH